MLVLCLCFALLASTSAVPTSRSRGPAVSQGRQFAPISDNTGVPGSAASTLQQQPTQFSPQAPPQPQPVEISNPGLQQYQPAVSISPTNPQLAVVEYEAPPNNLEPLPATQLYRHSPVSHLLRHSPANAQLLSVKPALTGIMSRLPDNATLLRPNIKDTFSCSGRTYGYYADPDNDCQIFHVCLPLHSLYPTLFKAETTYHFSFICGNQTSFDQTSMACVHQGSFTCDNPEMYYYLNYNFFRKVKTPEGDERWAWVNEDVPSGIKPGKPGSTSVSVSVPVPVRK